MVCRKCVMIFDLGDTQQETEHASNCDMILSGPKVSLRSPEEVVWAIGDSRDNSCD